MGMGIQREQVTMSRENAIEKPVREPVLSPVDRVSELLFGLFMALTFTGAVSVADAGREEIRGMFVAALGCNLAWGLVDAVMYLVRTITDRGRSITVVQAVSGAPTPNRAHGHRECAVDAAPPHSSPQAEVEAIRGRIVALPTCRRDRRCVGTTCSPPSRYS